MENQITLKLVDDLRGLQIKKRSLVRIADIIADSAKTDEQKNRLVLKTILQAAPNKAQARQFFGLSFNDFSKVVNGLKVDCVIRFEQMADFLISRKKLVETFTAQDKARLAKLVGKKETDIDAEILAIVTAKKDELAIKRENEALTIQTRLTRAKFLAFLESEENENATDEKAEAKAK